MVRNIMGCLVAVGSGRQPPGLDGRGAGGAQPRCRGADLSADGLYFLGPYYDAGMASRAHAGDGLAALNRPRQRMSFVTAPASRSAA
jgi:tRNA pseudouridine38-40 synthase